MSGPMDYLLHKLSSRNYLSFLLYANAGSEYEYILKIAEGDGG